MNKDISKLSTQIYKSDVLEVLENNYSKIGSLWVNLQVERCNDIYASFKDHDKYLIVIYLIRNDRKASIPLLMDVLLGICLFFIIRLSIFDN